MLKRPAATQCGQQDPKGSPLGFRLQRTGQNHVRPDCGSTVRGVGTKHGGGDCKRTELRAVVTSVTAAAQQF